MTARVSDKEMSRAYSYLYSHALPGKGLYAGVNRRAPLFIQWIREHVKPEDGPILDIGCGRGFAIRWLLADGYHAEGTEIADWLFDPPGDLCGLPVKKLYCSQLDRLPGNHYAAVMSNDVLEHLQTEQEIEAAIQQICRISKGPVLISTGGIRQAYNPFPNAVKFPVRGLHFVVNPREWWTALYCKYCVLEDDFDAAGSYFLIGHKHAPGTE